VAGARKPAPAGSEQGGAVGGGNTPASARRPGGRIGAKCGLDGVGDELGGLGVDGDIAAQQHPADDLPGVPGRVLQAVTVRRMYAATGRDGKRQHTVAEIAEAVGVHRTTVYDYLKKED
jgi:hypothetical protein